MRVGRAPTGFAAAARVAGLLVAMAGAAPLAACRDTKPAEPGTVFLTEIIITFKSPGHPQGTRTKEEALKMATSVQAELMAGRPIRDLLKFTDFVNRDHTPHNGGRYPLTRASPGGQALKDAAFATPVGGIGPKPIETEIAYVVFRRDE